MSIFLKRTDRESVSIDGGTNVVWVLRKMDLGTKNRVQDALMSVENFGGDGRRASMNLTLGRQNTILMQHNIVAWEGPLFRDEITGQPVPCTPEAIETLDPDSELVDAVLAKINLLNTKPVVVEGGKPVPLAPSGTVSSSNGKSGSKVTLNQEKLKPVNEWDSYVNFAIRFRWTPEQVDAMDPDFLDSLKARLMAEALNDWKPGAKK